MRILNLYVLLYIKRQSKKQAIDACSLILRIPIEHIKMMKLADISCASSTEVIIALESLLRIIIERPDGSGVG